MLNLLVVDLTTTLTEVTLVVGLAYVIRVLAMLAAGALSAWLHEDEMKLTRLFQLGMVAPALLTSMLNGVAVRTSAATIVTPQASAQRPHQGGARPWSALDDAVPAACCPAPPVYRFSYPKESTAAQIARGLLGVRPDLPDWIIQAGVAPTQADGLRLLGLFTKSFPQLPFRLYAPSAGVTTWVITVGPQFTQREAEKVKNDLAAVPGLVVMLRHLPGDPDKD